MSPLFNELVRMILNIVQGIMAWFHPSLDNNSVARFARSIGTHLAFDRVKLQELAL